MLFVSHDLKTVAEFCSRSLLLDHGRAIVVDPTPDVITRYMTLLRQHRAVSQDRPVVITAVRVRDAAGPCRRFQSGQKAWVDIEVVAREHTERSAVVLYLRDESHYFLFVTSTERLGHGNFSLDVGDTFCCTLGAEPIMHAPIQSRLDHPSKITFTL